MAKTKVLLIEDMKPVRQLTKDMITSINPNIKVVEATDGIEGFKMIETYFDELLFVLSDLNMPNASGRDFLNRASQTRGPDKVPVYIYTVEDDPEIVAALMERGAKEVIKKPLPIEKMQELIEKHTK